MHKRRTTIILDEDLLGEARAVLRTKGTTDTVHMALSEVIQREKRARLLKRDFSNLDLDALRRTPSLEDKPPESQKEVRGGASRH